MSGATLRRVAAGAAIATLGLGTGVAWAAPEGRIQQVESGAGAVTYVLSAEGLAEGQSIDPASVKTTLGGVDAPTAAVPVAGEAAPAVQRTTMIVLDSSGSMADDGKLGKAQDAARSYLATLPADVRAGLVTFADRAQLKVEPTEDRAAVVTAIDALEADGATALNDAVVLTVDTLGEQGSRNAVILSDGEDEGSRASSKKATKALTGSGVVLDAVSLGSGKQTAQLAAFARAGEGTVVTATDAGELTTAFEKAARTVTTQLAVTAQVPEGVSAGTSELVTSGLVGDVAIRDSAVAVLGAGGTAAPAQTTAAYGPIPVAEPDAGGFMEQSWFLPVLLGAMFVALISLVVLAIGVLDTRNRQSGRVQRRLQEVSVLGAPASAGPAQSETVLGESPTVRKAVSFADKVADSRDTSWLADKLDVANVKLRPGEWAVVHMLVVILAGLIGTLLSGFDIVLTLMAVAGGVLLPWALLSYRAGKRKAEFYSMLPDSLQMLAGSLSAGYSLPQALDNVAKESGGSMGQEVNRALIESRLGLPIEESLEAVAQRMDSEDFHWTVMAIRINRQVGGNLAEVLSSVSNTVRERERLRRQVKALSAEGKLSAWVLGILPLFVAFWIVWRNPGYLEPLYTNVVGWVMVAVGAVLYIGGVFWMRKLVTMEV
ncbi:MAG: type II secretion system F family protein [Candidatus Nanopelagicales bacterium]